MIIFGPYEVWHVQIMSWVTSLVQSLAPILVLNFESRLESRPGQNQDLCQDFFYIFHLCSWFSRSFESSLDPKWIFFILIRPWKKSSAILQDKCQDMFEVMNARFLVKNLYWRSESVWILNCTNFQCDDGYTDKFSTYLINGSRLK